MAPDAQNYDQCILKHGAVRKLLKYGSKMPTSIEHVYGVALQRTFSKNDPLQQTFQIKIKKGKEKTC